MSRNSQIEAIKSGSVRLKSQGQETDFNKEVLSDKDSKEVDEIYHSNPHSPKAECKLRREQNRQEEGCCPCPSVKRMMMDRKS